MTIAGTSVIDRIATDRLDGVLWANATFSALSGAAMLAFSAALAEWLEVPRMILLAAGLGLAGFAAFVAWVATQRPLPARHVAAIAVADLSWVVAAAAIVVIPGTLPAGGKLALALVSLVVLDLGVLEWLGYRRLRR